jgi:broad specificity phosphatase PhoE
MKTTESPSHSFTVHLLRHADRDPIPQDVHHAEILLNLAGRANAKAFGQTLRQYPALGLVSSPVGRCIETAECIATAHGNASMLRISALLGEPGPFVHDRDAAKAHFPRLGNKGIIKALANGQSLQGMHSLQEGTANLLRFMDQAGKISNADTPVIMVTHDVIIAAVIAAIFDVDHALSTWPCFLEALTLSRNTDGYLLSWRDRRLKIAHSFWEPASNSIEQNHSSQSHTVEKLPPRFG